MCFGGGNNDVPDPAPPPPPPEESADDPKIGKTRRLENEAIHGRSAPAYRVDRKKSGGSLNNEDQIKM